MSIEDKFKQGIVVEKKENGFYRLELWGGSTKHPDSVFEMDNYEFPFWASKDDPKDVESQVFQWLLECASKLTFPLHAVNLAKYALDNWRVWDK